ncbi:HAD-IB family phosphatase [Patescibacteria group bacterium]|nr:HAD-IB family phosphatase [Patescibacteria group bacterium]MBU2159214.1 HAD-IB family phosphatase [Patescibacteria group bacterium]MBU2220655.1 HAD-IB family phosphatase [Patescibacteria group bacterium]
MKRPVAVFDIDGTVYRSCLLATLMKELVARELIPKTSSASFEGLMHEDLHASDHARLMKKAVRAFAQHAKGLSYGDVADVAGELIEREQKNVFRYTRDLIKELKEEGHFLLAISHSPKFIVDGFAYELGFDKSYGIFYETGAASRFTGEIEDEHIIMNKASVLARALEKENLSLNGSVGVGGWESDVSMLDMVEDGIAFNPDSRLYRHAKSKLWKIVVERKDVIYEL